MLRGRVSPASSWDAASNLISNRDGELAEAERIVCKENRYHDFAGWTSEMAREHLLVRMTFCVLGCWKEVGAVRASGCLRSRLHVEADWEYCLES